MSKTVQDYVAALLSRKVVEEKVRGVPAPDREATSVFESLAINLLLNPRAVLYLAHLARNGLVKSLTDEIAAVDAVTSVMKDFSNVSISLKDTTALEEARTSLLQIEGQGRLSSGAALGRFNDSISRFLTELGKSVRGAGAAMVRPSSEAEAALPGAYQTLVSLHKDSGDRLSALATGVDGFFSSSVGSLLSLATVQVVRDDIEVMLREMSQDDSAANAREAVYRLVAARATLKTLSSPPSWNDAVSDVEPGDLVGGIEVIDVDAGVATLADGSTVVGASAQSGLAAMWSTLRYEVADAYEAWNSSGYADGLGKLDRALAGITAASPTAQVSETLRVLADVKTVLSDILSRINTPRPRSVRNEKKIVDGILATLEERGYDRAVSLLLRCKIVDTIKLDWQSASFAGNLMKAASDVAQNDVHFPNKEKDERTVFSLREG